MSTKLDPYILPDSIINTMREMIRETKTDELERQFDLCAQSNNILLETNRCTGNTCSVRSRKVCDVGQFIGTYHTHPFPFSEKPSSGDLLNIQHEGVGCIGSAKTDRIRCYKYKGYPFKGREKDYEYYKKAYEDLEKVDKIERSIATPDTIKKPELWPKIARQLDYLKEKDMTIKKYFRTIRV